MLTITPTVIIGIGSSGLSMINSARELMFEEFQYAGLPMIRFLHISSHTNGEPFYTLPNEQFINNWEQIKIVDISVDQNKFQAVSNKARKDSPIYDSNFPIDEWINPGILNIPAQSFNDGASNIRQAGRMCLWSNWENATGEIFKICNAVSTNDALKQTSEILLNYYEKKNIVVSNPKFTNTAPLRIVVCGTLTGGTGSGILLDIAYFLNARFPQAETYGIFSMLDTNTAAAPQRHHLAANNYAALIELDYFNQKLSNYFYQLPGYINVDRTNNRPFKDIYLMSTMNKSSSVAPIANNSGEMELAFLEKMIGCNIFFDIMGLFSKKDSITTNYASSAGIYGTVEKEPYYVRTFSSAGSTALWYPKSTIANIVACQKMEELCNNWLAVPNPDNQAIQQEADIILTNIRKQLLKKVSTFNINGKETTINRHYNSILEDSWKNISESPNKINALNKLFGDSFNYKGFYYNKIEVQLNQIISSILIEYEQTINSYISNILINQNSLSLNDLTQIIDIIKKTITKSYNNRAELPSSINFTGLKSYFNALENEEKRVSTELVFARKRIIKQHLDRIKLNVQDILNNLSVRLVDYFVIEVLNVCVNKLDSIRTKLTDPIREKISGIYSLAVEMEKSSRNNIYRKYSSIELLSINEKIDGDIDQALKEIDKQKIKLVITNYGFSEAILHNMKTSKLLFYQISGEIQKLVLELEFIKNFNIIDHINRKNLLNLLLQYAEKAVPMYEEVVGHQTVRVNGNPFSYISGGSQSDRNDLISNLKGHNMKFEDAQIDLDHILYFYNQESLIAISEMKILKVLENRYNYDRQSKNAQDCFIDKDSSKFDVILLHRLEQMNSEQIIKKSIDLFKNKMFSSSREHPEKGEYLNFIYTDKFFNKERTISLFMNNVKEFETSLAKQKDAIDEFYKKYQQCLSKGVHFIRDSVDNYYENLKTKIDEYSDEFKKEYDFYEKFVNELLDNPINNKNNP